MQTLHAKKTKQIKGEITVPGDKSVSHRALMINAIAQGKAHVKGLLMGEDNLATMRILQSMGVKIEPIKPGEFIVHGVGLDGFKKPNKELDCGNSGTGMRLLMGLLSGQSFDSTLVGDESLSKRPMARVANPLNEMGAKIALNKGGTPPVAISPANNLQAIRYELPMASAQVKSAILLAGLYANEKTEIIEPAPTRDHTERMLQACGADITTNENKISLTPGNPLKAVDIDVPGDISSAAFFMVAASIIPDSELTITNVGINPTRIGVINILKAMGANIDIVNERYQGKEPVADIIIHSSELKGIEIPLDQVPLAIDELPVILIAAVCANGTTVLKGAEELRVKETDRLAAMADGLTRLGIDIELLDDGMIVHGGQFQGGDVDSFGDHRIAMSFAVAAQVAKGDVTINDCKNIATSFPSFVELAHSVGMQINS